MRTYLTLLHVPLALVTGAAVASNPRFFPQEAPAPSGARYGSGSSVRVDAPSREILEAIQGEKGGPESPELRALRLAEEQFLHEREVEPTADWGPDDESTPRERRERRREASRATTSFLDGLNASALNVPEHRSIEKYLRYFSTNPQGRGLFSTWLERSGKYRPIIASALGAEGLPRDLEALVFIESGFWPTAKSSAGAVGLWQFMPATARAYGLTVNSEYDERRSIWRSSEAAAKHLSDLHARFKSWDLALAAYNFGYKNVETRLERGDTDDFWVLADEEGLLPEETRRYVPKVLAVSVLLNNLEHFGFGEVSEAKGLDAVAFEVPPGTNLKTIARAAGTSAAELRELNPEFLTPLVPDRGSPVVVHLPRAGIARAKTMLPRLLGDGLRELDEKVSDRFDWGRDVPMKDGKTRLELTNAQQMKSDAAASTEVESRLPIAPPAASVPASEPLMSALPDRSATPEPKTPTPVSQPLVAEPKSPAVISEVAAVPSPVSRDGEAISFITYRVRSGDTLSALASRFKVTEHELAFDNHIRDRSVVFRGQTLKVRDVQASPRRPYLLYRVRKGDTLGKIATRLRESPEQLATRNGVSNPDLIREGQSFLVTPG